MSHYVEGLFSDLPGCTDLPLPPHGDSGARRIDYLLLQACDDYLRAAGDIIDGQRNADAGALELAAQEMNRGTASLRRATRLIAERLKVGS